MTADPDTSTAPEPVATIRLDSIGISFLRPGDETLTVVTDLNLQVMPGRFSVIAGRSGSGKTSILRVAAGLSEATAGKVFWRGEGITGGSPDQLTRRRRALIGVMEQNAYLLPELTALENVLIPAVPDGRTRELRDHARHLLNELGLDQRTTHRPATLSGGEKQRVALARALLLQPPVLIADEPTASLDRRWADTVIDLLDQAAHGGTAVLAASHDPHLIDRGATVLTLD